jgi:hypothetical protein
MACREPFAISLSAGVHMSEPVTIVQIIGAAAAASGVAIAATTYLITRWVEGRRRRRDLTIDLWKAWRAPESRKAQRDVFKFFETDDRENFQLSQIADDTLLNIGNAEHFIIESAALMNAGLIDRQLFGILFQDSLPLWFRVSSRIARDEHVEYDLGSRLDSAYNTLMSTEVSKRKLSL